MMCRLSWADQDCFEFGCKGETKRICSSYVVFTRHSCCFFAAVVFCCCCFLLRLLLFAVVAGSRFCCVSGRCILNLRFAFSRMIFQTLMHLKFAVLALRDAFPRWKSSLPDIFIKPGCISSLEIIPAGHFHQTRMKFPAGNHPCWTFLSNQDASAAPNASLPELSIKSGCMLL